jgi:hypothetical protein
VCTHAGMCVFGFFVFSFFSFGMSVAGLILGWLFTYNNGAPKALGGSEHVVDLCLSDGTSE